MAPKLGMDADGDTPPCSVLHSYKHAKEWDDWKQEHYKGTQKAQPAVELYKHKWAKKAVYLQLQLKGKLSAEECMWKIDPSAPVPCPLEGGDMKGPLYLCILDAKRVSCLNDTMWHQMFIVYREPVEFWMKDMYYKPTVHVRWQMNKIPGVSVSRYSNDILTITTGISAQESAVVPTVNQSSCWKCLP